MAKPRKEDQDIEEAKRIMERLVKMPPKPHQPNKAEMPKRDSRSKDGKAKKG